MDVPETKPRLTSYVWEGIPTRDRKRYARKLIDELLTGEKRRQAANWINGNRYGETRLDNFIRNMEAALTARKKKGESVSVRMQWVFTKPCGCPVGVIEGSVVQDPLDAMVEMYGYGRELRQARDRGIDVQHVTHEDYEARYFEKMKGNPPCTHGGRK